MQQCILGNLKLQVVPVGDTLNHSSLPAKSLFGSAWRLPAGFQGRMQDVICQLVRIGMVPLCEMKANRVEALKAQCYIVRHMER